MSDDNTRSEDFRWVFANGIGLQLTDNEALITFGFTQDMARPKETKVDKVGIILTPRTAKLLSHILHTAIDGWEKSAGIEIPLPTEKKAEIERSMLQGKVATND